MKKKLPTIFYVLIAASLIGCSMPNTAEPTESVDNAAERSTLPDDIFEVSEKYYPAVGRSVAIATTLFLLQKITKP